MWRLINLIRKRLPRLWPDGPTEAFPQKRSLCDVKAMERHGQATKTLEMAFADLG